MCEVHAAGASWWDVLKCVASVCTRWTLTLKAWAPWRFDLAEFAGGRGLDTQFFPAAILWILRIIGNTCEMTRPRFWKQLKNNLELIVLKIHLLYINRLGIP